MRLLRQVKTSASFRRYSDSFHHSYARFVCVADAETSTPPSNLFVPPITARQAAPLQKLTLIPRHIPSNVVTRANTPSVLRLRHCVVGVSAPQGNCVSFVGVQRRWEPGIRPPTGLRSYLRLLLPDGALIVCVNCLLKVQLVQTSVDGDVAPSPLSDRRRSFAD